MMTITAAQLFTLLFMGYDLGILVAIIIETYFDAKNGI